MQNDWPRFDFSRYDSDRGVWFLGALLLVALSASATERPDHSDTTIDPQGIPGTLVLCGGGRLPEVVRDEFVQLAGGKAARLVIIPTASDDDTLFDDAAEVAALWKARGIESIATLHTRAREQANEEAFVRPLQMATAVWITGGRQSQIAAAYSGTLVETELRALIARGGVVGGTSAGAACQSRVMIVRGQIHPTSGLGLIPGALIDQHFLARDRKSRLLAALEKHPDLVGFGIDEGTALILRGRTLKCLGDSTVTVCLSATNHAMPFESTLKPGQHSDLTMLRRAARARCEPPFPSADPSPPNLASGSLVIVGGGRIPAEIAERFINLAGGPDAAIVVLPTANPNPDLDETRDAKLLESLGAKHVRVLTARHRDEVESPAFLNDIRQAKGLWFSGGRQWRFIDTYEGTTAIEAFRDVLHRGGVIGGTSAGATIQGEFLVRGSPLGNKQMMCPGYERGFGFLPGVAIDQHVAQRKRYNDLTQVVTAHPQLLGIGLDESTALVVQGHRGEVIGKGRAYFHDRRKPPVDGQPPYLSLEAGSTYDLVKGERLPAD